MESTNKKKLSGNIVLKDQTNHSGVLVLLVGEKGQGVLADVTAADGKYEFNVDPNKDAQHLWFAPTHVQIKDGEPSYFALVTASSIPIPRDWSSVPVAEYALGAATREGNGTVGASSAKQQQVLAEIEDARKKLTAMRARVAADLILPKVREEVQRVINELDQNGTKVGEQERLVSAGGLTDERLNTISLEVTKLLNSSTEKVNRYFRPNPSVR